MAFGLLNDLDNGKEHVLFQWGVKINAILFASILIVFTFVFVYLQLIGYDDFHLYSHPSKALAVVIGIISYIFFTVGTLKSQREKEKILMFGLAPLALFFVAHFAVPEAVIKASVPGPFLERHLHCIGDNDLVISDKDSIRAVCWYLKRNDVFVLGEAGEIRYGLTQKGEKGRRLDIKSGIDLIRQNPGKIVLIANAKHIKKWRNQLPKPVYQDSSGLGGYVLWKY